MTAAQELTYILFFSFFFCNFFNMLHSFYWSCVKQRSFLSGLLLEADVSASSQGFSPSPAVKFEVKKTQGFPKNVESFKFLQLHLIS